MADCYFEQDMDISNIQALYVFLEFAKVFPTGTIIAKLPILGASEKFGISLILSQTSWGK